MKNYENYLNKRTKKDLVISKESYVVGLLYMICYLIQDLKLQLETENRFFGIIITYMTKIKKIYSKILPNISEEEELLYQRILYLYKPAILIEFKKLRIRHVTKADCLISIIKKILDFILEQDCEIYKKETKSLNKIMTKLYDNIRNSGKKSKMYSLIIPLMKYVEMGQVGDKLISKFSIEEEEKKEEKKELNGTGIRINQSSNAKITEITWTLE